LGGFVNAAFGLDDPLTSWLGAIDLGDAGLLLIALLLAVWGLAALRGRRDQTGQGQHQRQEWPKRG